MERTSAPAIKFPLSRGEYNGIELDNDSRVRFPFARPDSQRTTVSRVHTLVQSACRVLNSFKVHVRRGFMTTLSFVIHYSEGLSKTQDLGCTGAQKRPGL